MALKDSLGFRRFQKDRLKVCKTELFAQKVRFCTLLDDLSGIGGNPKSLLAQINFLAISALWFVQNRTAIHRSSGDVGWLAVWNCIFSGSEISKFGA